MASEEERPITIAKPNLLIVEGKDDEGFFQALASHLGLSEVQVHSIRGKHAFPDRLKACVIATGFHNVKSVGVVRDANGAEGDALRSVCSALKRVGLPVPRRPMQPVGEAPRVTVFIMPGSSGGTMLEDLCLSALADAPAMECVEGYFCCLRSKNVDLPGKLAKGRVYAFLASKADPRKRLGEAARAGYLPWDHAAFDEVKAFLKCVCGA